MSTKPFESGDYVVYPAHGVGQVLGFESEQILESSIELLVVCFNEAKMILRLPLPRAKSVGLRHLTPKEDMEKVIQTLLDRHKTKRCSWTRRIHEYEQKINSGNPLSIAEVVRDLHRSSSRSDQQSYSERQIYQSAITRLAREIAAIESIDESSATQRLEDFLNAG